MSTQLDRATEQAATGQPTLHHTVAIVGMMGSGKTAVGRALAGRLGVPFVDSDNEIERAANRTIAEIFERDGEAFFRDREAEVIARLLNGTPAILSTGGGAFMQERNRTEISQSGLSLWLDVPLPTLWERVRHKSTRPLLRTADPQATLTEIYNTRTPIYRLADLAVEVAPANSIDETAERVIEALKSRPDILEVAT